METYTLPTAAVHVALFSISPANSKALLTRLVSASTLPSDSAGDAVRESLNFAFIDASMLSSRLHLLTAVQHALLAAANGSSLKTSSLPAEILWFLEPSNNISESLRHFGLRPATTSVVLIAISPLPPPPEESPTAEEVFKKMKQAVAEGTLCSLDELGRPELCDYKALRKLYKLNQDQVLSRVVKGSVQETALVDELCVSSVPLKAAS